MTSQPSTPVLAQETGPSCFQQIPADKDHSYHANQETQPGRLNLEKRHSDGDTNSPEASSTPAKLQASQNDEVEQDFTEGNLEGFVLVEHRRQRTTAGSDTPGLTPGVGNKHTHGNTSSNARPPRQMGPSIFGSMTIRDVRLSVYVDSKLLRRPGREKLLQSVKRPSGPGVESSGSGGKA
ncbi:hypothetical protein HPB47_017745 [Ixodes persulcatus]|uniref:Uncharacterized protein n=1 Tax=Ixodes persulcatus TaxID=34615 RepID=A0AC60R283_IXOPE|nr:hypothetical protein HPB47_017745 [Ixodes persulcatus]